MNAQNTWPGGHRHAMSQAEHAEWNANHHPGTRQLCEDCGEPTERCEEDSIFLDDGHGPLCKQCFDARCDNGEERKGDEQ